MYETYESLIFGSIIFMQFNTTEAAVVQQEDVELEKLRCIANSSKCMEHVFDIYEASNVFAKKMI